MRAILLLIVAFVTSGCATSRPTASPEDYAGARPNKVEVEQLLNSYFKKSLKDPDSIKDFALIGEPRIYSYSDGLGAGNNAVWLQCFRYNAKNTYGGYTGTTVYGAGFKGTGTSLGTYLHWVRELSVC